MGLPSFLPRRHRPPFERFFADADAGTLPPLTVVEPVYGRADDHPPAHPTAGQVLMAAVHDALARSPQWSRCLFVITYDEHGGFFDHVPPPLAPDDRADEGFDQLGFRVPTAFVGPYVKRGYVSHVPPIPVGEAEEAEIYAPRASRAWASPPPPR